MPAEKRRRLDPRREATRVALIEAAESLFAEAGFDGVSTRRIGAAIGSLNVNVVAYHFGSKEELVQAVYRHRLPAIDRRRGELLAAAEASGNGKDLAALMRVFALPWFEQVDSHGRHSFAGFILGIERAGLIATRGELVAEFPVTDRVNARLAALVPQSTLPLFNTRMRIVTAMILATLQLIDREASGDPAAARELFDNCLAMATAALAAPVPLKGIAR
jgi:AcrR family transcriptional regulator